MKSLLLPAAFILATTSSGSAETLIRDFFGSIDPVQLQRVDDVGNIVSMFSNGGPTLIGIDGIRAQFPNSSTEVWHAPGGQHAATWFFASASTDANEPPTPGDLNNLILAGGADAGTGGHLAALLPFTPIPTPFQVSADMIPQGGDTRDWVAIGFTSSLGTLNSNFESFGQAWLQLNMNTIGLGPTTWVLHTNGTTGPSITGTTDLTGQYIPMTLTYDPVNHIVNGTISGVPTGDIPYTATGITGVGMESVEHVSFSIADNFAVQSVPEPATLALFSLALATLAARRRIR